MLSGVATAGTPAPTPTKSVDPAPAVRVTLDRTTYVPGDQAHVQVDIHDDGYLVVMRVSPDGLVRVLFPLDPTDDNFVRGGKSYEIVGRDGGEAFTVEATSGAGVVYAAWSAQQFQFNDFTRDGHWDYTVLGDSAIAQDPETGLSNLVGRMATAHFDYDLQSYNAQQEVAYARPNYYMDSYGYGDFYDPFYDPYFYGYGPYYGGAFISIGFGGGPFFYSPFRPYPSPFFFRRPFFTRPFGGCFDCGVFGRERGFLAYSPFRFKGGVPGGSTIVGVQYRPRTFAGNTGFARTGFTRGPGVRFAGMSGGGMHTLNREPGFRPADVSVRRAPTSLRVPNATARERARMDGPTVFGPGRRAPFSGSRAVPDRPHFEPTVRAPQSFRGGDRPAMRAGQPGTRVAEPPTRVNAPRGRSNFESMPRFNGPAERVPASRGRSNFESMPRFNGPAERVPAPRGEAPRMEAPRMEPQRFEAPRPETRVETPRFEGARAEPRMAPREAPREAPRMSSPRMSAPRMSAPRMSAPRMSAPRGGGGGGGGGGHHHR
ncbi:MAG TPA: DUF4384 domain-containing protein [Gemmatimonadaceae bacterium]|nr:DUF4384 domain-containing protein [Gemmatimonadaceae bacterium]